MNLTEFHKEIKGYTQDRQPGIQKDMNPQPITEMEGYKSGGKLQGKIALVTGEIRGLVALLRYYMPKKGQMWRLVISMNTKMLKR